MNFKGLLVILLILFVFFNPASYLSASPVEQSSQKVHFLKINKSGSLIFELGARHPTVGLRENISLPMKSISFAGLGDRCIRETNLELHAKRWVPNFLNNSDHIEIKRTGGNKFFELIVDGKNLENEISSKICP